MNHTSKAEMSAQLLSLADCERKPLIAELFHALNQPLTTLRCALELALLQPRTAEQTRETVRQALAQAERVAWLASGLQELMASDDAGDNREVLELEVYVQQVVIDLLPVAEAAGVQLSLHRNSACCVLLEPRRLRQALLHLVECALSAARPGTTIKIEIREQDDDTMLTLETAAGQNVPESRVLGLEKADGFANEPQLGRKLQLAIVRGIIEASGGKFHMSSNNDAPYFEVRLPQTIFPK